MPADIRSILDPLQVNNSVKADAWDAFHAAASPEDFRARFDKLQLPKEVKASLWDAKFSSGGTTPTPAPGGGGLDSIDQQTLGANVQTFMLNGPQLPNGQRLPTAAEAVAGAEASAKTTVNKLLQTGIPGMEKLGQLPGISAPQNPIQPLTTPLGAPNGSNADGFSAADFGGRNGVVNVPQGEFFDAMNSYGDKVLGPTPQGTGLGMAVGRGTAKFLLNMMSPDSAATMLAFELGGAAAPAIANAAPVARALRDLPKVAKALDVAGQTAAPAAGVYLGGKAAVQGGKQAYDQGMQGDFSGAVESATETALGALLAGLSVKDAVSKAKETLASFPSQQNAPTTFTAGQDQATALRQQGKRLAADQWADQARKVATNKWQQVFGEEIPVEFQGENHTIRYQGAGEKGRPSFELVNDSTGEVVYSGYGRAMQDFLRGRGAKPKAAAEAPTEAPAGEVAQAGAQNDQTTKTTKPDPVGEWIATERAQGREPQISDVQRQFEIGAGAALRALKGSNNPSRDNRDRTEPVNASQESASDEDTSLISNSDTAQSRGSDRSTEPTTAPAEVRTSGDARPSINYGDPIQFTYEDKSIAGVMDAYDWDSDSPSTTVRDTNGKPYIIPKDEIQPRERTKAEQRKFDKEEKRREEHNAAHQREFDRFSDPDKAGIEPPSEDEYAHGLDVLQRAAGEPYRKHEEGKPLTIDDSVFYYGGTKDHPGGTFQIGASKGSNTERVIGQFVREGILTPQIGTEGNRGFKYTKYVVDESKLPGETEDEAYQKALDYLERGRNYGGDFSEHELKYSASIHKEENQKKVYERLLAEGRIEAPKAPEKKKPKNKLQEARDKKRAAKAESEAPVPLATKTPHVVEAGAEAPDPELTTELEEAPPSVTFSELENAQNEEKPITFRDTKGKVRTGTVEQLRTTKQGKRLIFARDEDGKAHVFGPDRVVSKPKKEETKPERTLDTAESQVEPDHEPGEDIEPTQEELDAERAEIDKERAAGEKKVTPQVPSDGTKYVLPSFVTDQYTKAPATNSQPTPQETPAISAPEEDTQTDPATNSDKPAVPKSPRKPRKLKAENTPHAATDRAASAEPQGQGDRSPLAEVPADDGRGTGTAEQAEAVPVGSTGADAGSSVRSGSEAEDAEGPSGGDRSEGVAATSGRERESSPVRSGPVDSASSPTRDFRITDADAIGVGTPREKVANNIAAIRLLKQIESEGREATREEQAVLAKYVGWGGLAQAFDRYRHEWQKTYNELEELLTPEEFTSARASTPNAHYTSPMVIRAMWDAVERLGLPAGARVIEPAIGVGNFFGLMPENLLPGVRRTGVELDQITGRIAAKLYPDANIQVKGFEKLAVSNNFFDLAISNVPFGNYGVHDSAYKKAPKAITGSIHDFFFAKSLDKVRPGGVVAFITSSYTMDKKDSTVREYLADRGDLIGAIRLPNTAFKGNAGTEVTTDIIFIQKRAPQTEAKGESWVAVGEAKTKSGNDLKLNEYYVRHPEMMLGEMSVEHGMYANNEQTLNGTLTPELLAAAVQKLPEGIIKPWEGEQSAAFQTPLSEVPAAGATKNNGFAVDKKGTVVVRRGDSFEPANLSQKAAEKVKALLPVRDAVREVYRTQLSDTATEAQVTKARTDLNRIYDAFVKKHGFISEKQNYKAFDGDPDQPVLLSLEDYDTEKKTAKKTDVFSKRTIDRQKQIDKADTASEALTVSLNELGRIDFARMQQLTGKTPAELQAELGPLAYKNPDGAWETADEYLSGNVRAKLNVAEEAAKADPVYQRNVDALKSVQPEDLQAHEIEAGLGATWIPEADIAAFIAQTLEIPPSGVSVGYAAPIGQWVIHIKHGADTVTNSQTFGTRDFFGHELISNEMNGKIPVAYDHFADGTSAKNAERSIAAQDKQEQLAEKFRQWIWANEARAARLTRKYNDEFNNLRLREYDGSHLTFPGMARLSLRGGDLDPHQKNAVWRILQSGGNTLLAHVVGAGKTFEMVTAAMEMRRLGLAKKPMFTVPNHLVEQTGAEFLRLYPAANLFVAGKEYFEGGEREKAMARIASGNYDAVIVAHSSFGLIPIKDETYESFMQEQMKELEDAIEEMAVAEGKKGKTVKELEKAKKRFQAKIDKRAKRDEKDTAIDFESLGVDALFVDEAHMFKNLFFVTKRTRVAGLPTSESDRAFDMFMKTQYVSKLNGGRGVVFATGTPVSNTLAEMYTMQRYLQMPYLKQQGMGAFDAWANNFAKSVTGMELAPDGSGYRMNTRFAKFVNLPELMSGFRLTADIQTAEMLNLPRPKLQGGKPVGVPAPASQGLKAFVQTLVKRAEDVRSGKVDPRDDNMLLITTHGRWAALDMRMVDPNAPNDPNSKVNQTIDRVHKIWSETKNHTFNDGTTGPATQLVFLDFSMPLKHRGKSSGALTNFSAYDEIRAQLIKKGVPAAEIAFIHDYDGGAKKAQLFTAVRAGKIRILLGSTEKMGAGTNVQKRLIALHHVDAPWRPSDIEQREGRILRQGNTNPEVQVYRYVTEGSFDAYMWQTLENKAKFISQVMRGGSSVRSLEDLEGGALTYAEIKAIASGNPAVMEKVKVDTELRKLESLKTTHDAEKRRARMEMGSLPGEIAKTEGEIERYQADIAHRDSSEKVYTVGKRTFTGDDARKHAAEAIHTILENTRDDEAPFRIGSYQGFELWTKKAPSGFGQSARNLPDISIRGKSYQYHASSNEENPSATLQSIEATVRNLGSYPEKAEVRLAVERKKLADYSAKVNDPFSQEDRLQELRAKQKELAAALDLGKSDKQAGTAADDTSPRPVSEILSDETGSFKPGALVDRAKEAYNSEAGKGARDFFKPVSTRIAEQGKAGVKLRDLLIKARDEGETAAGPRVAKLVYDSGIKELTRDERFNLVDVMEGKARPVNAKVAKAFAEVRSITDELANEAMRVGVKVKRTVRLGPNDPIPAGTTLNPLQQKARAAGRFITVRAWVPYQKRNNYYPHHIPAVDQLKRGKIRADIIANIVRRGWRNTEADAEKFLQDYITFIETAKGGNALMSWLVQTKQAPNHAEAMKLLEAMREDMIRRNRNLEYSRSADLPFWDPDPLRVMPGFITHESKRLSQIEHFGQNHERITRLRLAIKRQGGNSDWVKQAVKEILGENQQPDGQLDALSRWLRMAQGFKLGLAGIPNATQGSLNSLLKGDLLSTVAGVKGLFSQQGRRFGTESGAALDSVLNEAMRLAGEDGRMLGTFLKWTGFTATERWNRILAANAGKAWAERQARKLRLDPNNAVARAALTELGIDPASVIQRGGLSPKDVLMAAKKFSDITQFRGGPEDLPQFSSTPIGRVFFQFKSYIYGQSRLIVDSLVGEWQSGNRARAVRNLLILAAVFPMAGAVAALRGLLKRKNPNEKDKTLLQQYFADVMAVGALGVLGDMIEGGKLRKLGGVFLGPSLSTIAEGGEAAVSNDPGRNIGKWFTRQLPLGSVLASWLFPPRESSSSHGRGSRRLGGGRRRIGGRL